MATSPPNNVHGYENEYTNTSEPSSQASQQGDQFQTPKIPSKRLVEESLKRRAVAIDQNTCNPGDEDTFFVADLGEVFRQQIRWKNNLGRVKPHYAVKCNPDPNVLRLLAALGCGFDCASKAEIDTVLKIGVDPSRIIYAQPCKTASYIRYAAAHGVKQMTFDNTDELYKIKRFHPEAELFLRILTDDSASLCRLSLKFGAAMDKTGELLQLAKDLNLNVTGVAFHIGSGASDPNAFLKALSDARTVFDTASSLGLHLRTLDVGGGFISDTFEAMAAVLSKALEELFPAEVRVIGEPGRYYVSGAFTIACNVIARRTVEDRLTGEKSYMLYLNDGVYGNFSSIVFDHQHPVPQVLTCRALTAASTDVQDSGDEKHDPVAAERIAFPPTPPLSRAPSPTDANTARKPITYSIWGPTCDGIDCISESTIFKDTLDVGDWLYFEDMGAYTKCSATRFNGFTDQHEVVYVSSERAVAGLLGW